MVPDVIRFQDEVPAGPISRLGDIEPLRIPADCTAEKVSMVWGSES